MAMTLEEPESEMRLRTPGQKIIGEPWKLQSLYSHRCPIGRNSEAPSLFVQKTPGVITEMEDRGGYEGIECVTRFRNAVFDVKMMHRSAGFLAIPMTVNPVIITTEPVPSP
jgi:hypothetical protein